MEARRIRQGKHPVSRYLGLRLLDRLGTILKKGRVADFLLRLTKPHNWLYQKRERARSRSRTSFSASRHGVLDLRIGDSWNRAITTSRATEYVSRGSERSNEGYWQRDPRTCINRRLEVKCGPRRRQTAMLKIYDYLRVISLPTR